MSRRKPSDNPNGFIRAEDCRERHAGVADQLRKQSDAMFGPDGRGGMVKDIGDIKADVNLIRKITNSKQSWKPKDYIALVSALLAFFVSVLTLLLK